jgi:uncharacterized OB-fold protein
VNKHQNKISVDQCSQCEALYIPPKYACPECGGTEFKGTEIEGLGKLLTYSTVRAPPLGFEGQAPYLIGIIELSNGLNLTARLKTKENQEPTIDSDAFFLKKESGAYWFMVNK